MISIRIDTLGGSVAHPLQLEISKIFPHLAPLYVFQSVLGTKALSRPQDHSTHKCLNENGERIIVSL